MPISFGDLTNAQKLDAADIMQKIEAIDDQLAKIQTIRATKEAEWNGKENNLRTFRMNLQDQLRAIRQAVVTEV